MAVQTMGLDYSWLINLADIISQARMSKGGQRAKPVAAPAPQIAKAQPAETPGLRTPGFAERQREEWAVEKEAERASKEAALQRAHEVGLKEMDVESALAQAMSKERVAGVGAEAGVKEARIGGAAEVAGAQKTTMEKGYEFVEMLMSMDEDSANKLIANLEAKRGAPGERPISTITSGGETRTLPGTTAVGDPNDPLTWLEEIGAYTPGAGAPRGKATGAAAKPEIDQYLDLIDDMLDKNPRSIVTITTGKGWDELKERMRTIGAEAGFSEDTINAGIAMYEALVPEPEPEPEPGTISKIWTGAETTAANVAPFIHQALHPGERTPEAETQKQLWEEGAGRVGEPSEAVKSFAELTERLVTGPFYPAYSKARSKKTGKPIVKEPKAKEVGKITEQDVITEMRTWNKEKVIEFQRAATKAGLYKGPINGLHSNELDAVMKKYFKEHPEEWGEAK